MTCWPVSQLLRQGTKMNLLRSTVLILGQAPKATHEQQPFFPKKGNFTLVTDAPELRFHDGKTPGGVVIALDPKIWDQVKQIYASKSGTKTTGKNHE